jgi:hypothetical protein
MHTIKETIQFHVGGGLTLTDDFYLRMCRFYSRTSARNFKMSFIWSNIFACFYNTLHDALMSGNIEIVRGTLETAYSSRIIFGLFNGESWSESEEWKRVALLAATRIGTVPVFNPEQPAPMELSIESVVSDMSLATGAEISHPGIPGMSSAIVGDKLVPYQLMEAVHTLANVAQRHDNPRFSMEIGAGLGLASYWLLRSIAPLEHHIVDLPIVSVMGAFCIATALGEHRLCFNGESQHGKVSGCVFVHGTHPEFNDNLRFDLVLNQNSMPEMEPEDLERYLALIAERMSKSGMFISLNHESEVSGQGRVCNSMKKHTELRRISRNLSPCRAGYVEEVWMRI